MKRLIDPRRSISEAITDLLKIIMTSLVISHHSHYLLWHLNLIWSARFKQRKPWSLWEMQIGFHYKNIMIIVNITSLLNFKVTQTKKLQLVTKWRKKKRQSWQQRHKHQHEKTVETWPRRIKSKHISATAWQKCYSKIVIQHKIIIKLYHVENLKQFMELESFLLFRYTPNRIASLQYCSVSRYVTPWFALIHLVSSHFSTSLHLAEAFALPKLAFTQLVFNQ